MSHEYRPEIDVSAVLDENRANYYQNLIGVLRWAIELGRVDIYLEVSLLLAYNAQPRQGHLEQVFHILHTSNHTTVQQLFLMTAYLTSMTAHSLCMIGLHSMSTLRRRFQPMRRKRTVTACPCSRSLMQTTQETLSHADLTLVFSFSLTKHWYCGILTDRTP